MVDRDPADPLPSLVAEHLRTPRNVGREDTGPGWRSAERGEPRRGPWLRLALRFDGSRIAEVRWQALGCPYLLALVSLASERLPGGGPERLEALRPELVEALALPVERTDRMLLLEDVFEDAVRAAGGEG